MNRHCAPHGTGLYSSRAVDHTVDTTCMLANELVNELLFSFGWFVSLKNQGCHRKASDFILERGYLYMDDYSMK